MTSLAFTREYARDERAAWDTYVVATLALTMDVAVAAAMADRLLAERRQRFVRLPPSEPEPFHPTAGTFLDHADRGQSW